MKMIFYNYFPLLGNLQSNYGISCKNPSNQKVLHWTWFNKGIVKLEPANFEMENQQNFKLLTGSGTGLVKIAKGQTSRALKFSQKENALLATNEKPSETEIKPGIKMLRAPCLETFLVFPKDNETKYYLR